MPVAYSDGTCVFCHEGPQTSCIHGGLFGTFDVAGAQAEAVRIALVTGRSTSSRSTKTAR
jgi:hypothetical protein